MPRLTRHVCIIKLVTPLAMCAVAVKHSCARTVIPWHVYQISVTTDTSTRGPPDPRDLWTVAHVRTPRDTPSERTYVDRVTEELVFTLQCGRGRQGSAMNNSTVIHGSA